MPINRVELKINDSLLNTIEKGRETLRSIREKIIITDPTVEHNNKLYFPKWLVKKSKKKTKDTGRRIKQRS